MLLTLHPHTSEKLQPLYVGIYSPFRTHYNAAMESWRLNNQGKALAITDLAELIGTACTRTMTPRNIINNAHKKENILLMEIFSENKAFYDAL